MTHQAHGPLSSRSVLIAMALNFGVFALELAGGLLSGSLALLSDAAHNLSDFATLALALLATRLVLRHATGTRTFGYARSEIIVAFVNALTLLGVGGFIVYEAIRRIVTPAPVTAGLVLVFGAVGLAANLGSTLVLRPHAHADLNARSAFLHLATDAAESGAIVLGGVLMMVGVPLVDPVLSVLIGLLTVKGAYDVLADSTHILVEGAPQGLGAERVAAWLRAVDGVCDVHHVHVWSLSSNYHAASAHVVIPDQMVGASRELIERMSAALGGHGITHPTFQLEIRDCTPDGRDRLLPASPAGTCAGPDEPCPAVAAPHEHSPAAHRD